jgi:hypothetical protein
VIGMIWGNMLKLPPKSTIFGELFNVRRGDEVPEYMAWTMVALVFGSCILLLNRRLRAKEVVS